ADCVLSGGVRCRAAHGQQEKHEDPHAHLMAPINEDPPQTPHSFGLRRSSLIIDEGRIIPDRATADELAEAKDEPAQRLAKWLIQSRISRTTCVRPGARL